MILDVFLLLLEGIVLRLHFIEFGVSLLLKEVTQHLLISLVDVGIPRLKIELSLYQVLRFILKLGGNR